MKKIVFCLLLLTFSFRLAAQIDYLEPVKPFSTYTGELGEYYRSVFSLLNTGFQKQPYARFSVIPSFSPEYAMSVEKRNGRYTLISNTLSRTYWQAEKGTVTVDTKSVVISASLYQSLGAIFRLVTEQVQDLDGSTAGLDGIVYFFSSTDAKGKEQMGRKWSPEKGTLMERLVLVCQSAYMLSRGGNISEQTLAVEAAALLKALQQRTKEEPDAYKRPMYIGIYPVGPRLKTLSGNRWRNLLISLRWLWKNILPVKWFIRQGFWRRMFRVMLYVSLLLIKKGLSFVLIFYVPLIRNLQRRFSALSKGCRNGHLHWWEESQRIVITFFMFLSVRNSIGINKQLCNQSPINKKEILHL